MNGQDLFVRTCPSSSGSRNTGNRSYPKDSRKTLRLRESNSNLLRGRSRHPLLQCLLRDKHRPDSLRTARCTPSTPNQLSSLGQFGYSSSQKLDSSASRFCSTLDNLCKISSRCSKSCFPGREKPAAGLDTSCSVLSSSSAQ